MADQHVPLTFYSEDISLQRRARTLDYLQYVILKPPDWLKDLESPFKWGRKVRAVDLVCWNIPGKICDYDNQGAFYGFERLAFLLTMLFLQTIKEQEDKFLERSESIESDKEDSEEEEIIDEFEPDKCYIKSIETLDEMAACDGDIMYSRIGPALQHVVQATRAHILFLSGNHAESRELARNIQPIEEMSQECKAGFEGLKAKVILSMYQNFKIVLPFLHKAMELDPNFGYWPYLIGKVLRRARREFDEDTLDEEFKYFEKAVSLERNPKFLVFLGQAYQEMAFAILLSRNFQSNDSIERLNLKAIELYRECWSLKNDSAAISRRVGNNMAKIRSEIIDKTVAKEALIKSIELSPNECTFHALGKFYYFHERDDLKALEQFEKCHPGDFGTSEIIRLNLIKDPDYDPYDILQPWLKFEENTVKQYRSFCDAAWYYMAFKKDLKSAAEYIWKVLKRDNKFIRAKRALEYRSYGFCVKGPINLIELLVNEILILKEKNESLPLEDREDIQFLEDILDKLMEKYSDLHNFNPNPNLLDDLKQDVNDSITAKRNKRYKSGQIRWSKPSRGPEEIINWRNNGAHSGTQEDNQARSSHWQRSTNQKGGYLRNSFSDGDDERRHSGTQDREDFRRDSQWQRPGNRMGFDLRNRSGGDDDRRIRDEQRRNSEARARWGSGEGNSNQDTAHSRFSYNSRGRTERLSNSYNNNRYDVTITDWRSENRKQ